MKNKCLYYLFFGIITFFSLSLTVFGYEEIERNDFGEYYALFGDFSSKFPFTEETYMIFKNYMNDYIENNLDVSKTYLVYGDSSSKTFYMSLVPYEDGQSYMFSTSNSSLVAPGLIQSFARFKYVFSNDNKEIEFEHLSDTSFSNNDRFSYINNNFRKYATYPFLWASKPLKYLAEIDNTKTYYKYVFTVVPDELKMCGYDTVGVYSISNPIYSYLDLKFCDYKEQERVKVTYKIEYYFDDILDPNKTEYKSDYLYTKINSYGDYSTEMYKLVEGNYSIVLNEDETLNVLKIYYRSPLYGTEKQAIDTSKSKVYLFFQYEDIKAMFSNVTFENFNQFEQLVIVVLFNILYCIFITFCVLITLKACQKVWSWIMGFVL